MKIKSCPFCGHNTGVLTSNYSFKSKKYFVWVECDICGARSKAATSEDAPADSGWSNAACHKAAVAWNARCPDAE